MDERLQAGLPEVGEGLVPDLASEGVLGQPLDVLAQPTGIELLDGLDDSGVEGAAARLEQASIRDLVRQRVLEGVLDVGEEARLVQELRGSQVREAAAH